MLQQKSKLSKAEGFTIIEVLIVLAIAGIILLIVFLAVPALQRNSRNTSIKNDAAGVLGAMTDFNAANNGQMPTVAGTNCTNGLVTVAGAAGTTAVNGKVRGGTVCNFFAGVPTTPPAGATGTLNVGINAGCDTAGTGSIAKNRAFAALYRVEATATTEAVNCTES